MQLHEIAQKIQELRFEARAEEPNSRQMFNRFQNWYREQSGGKNPQIGLDDFKKIDEKVVEQMAKPLQLAALELDAQETEAREAIIELLYEQKPAGPEETRHFLKLATDVRSQNNITMLAAITEATQKFAGEELAAQVEACWPGIISGDDETPQ